MKILLYENEAYREMFPLNMMRAVYDVRTGAYTIKERTEKILRNKFELVLHCRKYLSAYLQEIHKNKINQFQKDDYLMLNGRAIFTEKSLKHLISGKSKNTCYVYNKEIIAAYLTKDKSEILNSLSKGIDENLITNNFFANNNFRQVMMENNFEVKIMRYPWEILNYLLHGGLDEEFEIYLNGNKNFVKQKDSDNLINRKRIFISKNVKIKPQVILDASEGSIIINEHSLIEPFTYIKGPVFIGKNTLVKSGTRLYGPCVIGEYSKVSGEIAESVFQSYVNKQHDGFTGHSYICPFVNLGADTVTSDLKNNYSKIRINVNGKDFETGMQFLGSIIGDHAKTSINTMLNTGTIAGIFANIFGGGFPPKNIESFSWIDNADSSKTVKYDIDKAVKTARVVMERRGISLSGNYEELMRQYY